MQKRLIMWSELWFSTKTDFDEAVFLSDKHSIYWRNWKKWFAKHDQNSSAGESEC